VLRVPHFCQGSLSWKVPVDKMQRQSQSVGEEQANQCCVGSVSISQRTTEY
jgi:hypothetical protein